MSAAEIVDTINAVLESSLDFLFENEDAFVLSLFIVCTTSLGLDLVKLKHESPRTPWKNLVSAYVPTLLATGAVIRYAFATFPTTNQVLFLQGVLVAAKVSRWLDLERRAHPYAQKSVLARLALLNFSKLSYWINLVPNFCAYFVVMIAWEWLKRGDKIEDDRLKNYSLLPKNGFTLALEIGEFSVIFIDLVLHLKDILSQFKGRKILGKIFVVVYFLIAASFILPPAKLIHRRLKEEGIF